MSAPTREEFAQLAGTYEAQAYDHGYCEGCASYDDEGLSGAKRTAGRAESRMKATGAALLAAYDAIAAERDAAKMEAERLKPGAFVPFSKRCETCGGRDPRKALPHEAGATDPRIEAWRGLDAKERKTALDLLRNHAHVYGADTSDAYSVEKSRAYGAGHAALEALGEKP